MTDSRQREAVKLIRVLASYTCVQDDGDGVVCDEADDRVERCGPCHAHAFLQILDRADSGEVNE